MATTRYIAPTGSNVTGDGTSGLPWATLAYAVASADSGDTIHCAAGTYGETASADIDTKILTIIADGAVVFSYPASPTYTSGTKSPINIGASESVELRGTAANTITITGNSELATQLIAVQGCTLATFRYVTATANANNGGTGMQAWLFVDHATRPTTILCDHCQATYAGQDGFSLSPTTSSGSQPLTATFDTCVAHHCGEDGFTSHYANSTVYSNNCESYSNGSGFAPAYTSTWTSRDDYLHDNTNSWPGKTKKFNLDLIGGCDFTATRLRMGGSGTLISQMRVTGAVGRTCTVTFNGGHWENTPCSGPLFTVEHSSATHVQTINWNGFTFAGSSSDATTHSFDDAAAVAGKLALNFRSCAAVLSTNSAKALFTFRDAQATPALFENCYIVNSTGRGIYAETTTAGRFTLVNSYVEATAGAWVLYGGGYNATSANGYNIINGATTGISAKTGDTIRTSAPWTVPGVDAFYHPTPGGNCDWVQGSATQRAGCAATDLYRKLKVFSASDVIGPAFPPIGRRRGRR